MYIESKSSLMTSLKRYRLLLAGVGLVALVGVGGHLPWSYPL